MEQSFQLDVNLHFQLIFVDLEYYVWRIKLILATSMWCLFNNLCLVDCHLPLLVRASLTVDYQFFFFSLKWCNTCNLGSYLLLRIGYLTNMKIMLEFTAEAMKIEANWIILYFNYELFFKIVSSLYQTVLFGDFQCLDEVQSYILVNRTLEEDHLVEGYNVHGFLHLVSSFPFYLLFS